MLHRRDTRHRHHPRAISSNTCSFRLDPKRHANHRVTFFFAAADGCFDALTKALASGYLTAISAVEPVAHGSLGHKILGLRRILLELGAQVPHVDTHVVTIVTVTWTPHFA